MSWTTFSAQIKAELESVQQAGAAAFVEVYEEPTSESDGNVWAVILPSQNSAVYANIKTNYRTYAFSIFIYHLIEQGPTGEATAWNNMRTLVDSVLDELDRSNDLSGTAAFLRPANASWSVQEVASGHAVVAGISVIAEKDVSLI